MKPATATEKPRQLVGIEHLRAMDRTFGVRITQGLGLPTVASLMIALGIAASRSRGSPSGRSCTEVIRRSSWFRRGAT